MNTKTIIDVAVSGVNITFGLMVAFLICNFFITQVNATPNLNFNATTTIDFSRVNTTAVTIFPGFALPAYLLDIIGIIVFMISLFTIHGDDVTPAIFCMVFLFIISIWQIDFVAFAGIIAAILFVDEFGKIKATAGIP